jgi:hypothetical protein
VWPDARRTSHALTGTVGLSVDRYDGGASFPGPLRPLGQVGTRGKIGRPRVAEGQRGAEDYGEAFGPMYPRASRAPTGPLGHQLIDTIVEHRSRLPSPRWRVGMAKGAMGGQHRAALARKWGSPTSALWKVRAAVERKSCKLAIERTNRARNSIDR